MASLLSVRRISVIYLLVVIVVSFGVLSPDLFLSSVTLQAVGSSQAIVLAIALAAMLPLIAGEFDITVGVNMALSLALVCWQTVEYPDRNFIIVCLIAVAASTIVGLVNAVLVVKLRLDSFIATLAMSQIVAALAVNISENAQIRAELPQGFSDFGQDRVLGLPVPLLVAVALGAVLWYVLEWTKLGRQLFAIGMNREAARLSGVRADGLIMGSFVASGFICGCAGVLFASQIGVFSNSVGMPLLFPAFAAVFLGATQFTGRPNVWGTFLALITLALGVQGLQLTLTSGGYWITPMFNGLALILAVLFSVRQKAASRTAVKEQSQTRPPSEGVVADDNPAPQEPVSTHPQP